MQNPKNPPANQLANPPAQKLPKQNLPFCTLESRAFRTKADFREAIKSQIKSNLRTDFVAKSSADFRADFGADFNVDFSSKSSQNAYLDSSQKTSAKPYLARYATHHATHHTAFRPAFCATPPQISYSHRHLNALLEKILLQKRFKNILLYHPLSFEANILPLLKKLKKTKNKRIFLPTIKGLNFKMLSYRLPLVKNTLGIFEPRPSSYMPKNIDFALIPALGIDRDFARIGMGKGMYDRVFAPHTTPDMPHKKHKSQQICKVFISQNLYISHHALCENFDIRASMYLSYKFAKSQKKGFNNVLDTSVRFFRFRGASRSGGIFYLPKNR